MAQIMVTNAWVHELFPWTMWKAASAPSDSEAVLTEMASIKDSQQALEAKFEEMTAAMRRIENALTTKSPGSPTKAGAGKSMLLPKLE